LQIARMTEYPVILFIVLKVKFKYEIVLQYH